MKAVVVNQPGGAEQLQVEEVSKPSLGKGELLIKVKAAAINRTDIISREGKSGYMKNPILGVEVAGEVVDGGEEATVPLGTRVMGLVNGGGYAEYAVMPTDRAMVIPDSLSYEEAAAIPEVFLTAFQTLFWLGELSDKETVLIHAGGSGVGTAAIQLASQLTNAKIITTAGSREKLDYCRSLGADIGINYKEQDFAEEVLKETNGVGADVILDFIGASYWEKNLKSIAVDGRWVLIGMLGGSKVDEIDLMSLMGKRVHLKGTLLTPRSDDYKQELTTDFAKNALPLFKQGKLKAIVDRVFPMEETSEAHRHMEANKNIGKIIVAME
ncbi:Beta-ketoacyl-acyl-carrier-protein synthase I [Oceanobacillus picturae]|uniref:Beta-ketoacyl-acyl-carrier-protein synthase I n=1 Tax=Oceanobacillus picturae TaxID=171693 RepID=W9AFW1_9BACI|nr:NAD(P)H-quinone oxidoreductase [Oceanobacillus picturae]RIU91389.1 NAD(P)H-quinone oxidoreductase [Oceanobacillus picturae]CDO04383.1 Beta-ketoacyl-acyl-carrier-protein synthase I [Oceanobacillus picturae]